MTQHELLYYFFFLATCFLSVISIALYKELKECRRENAALTAKLAEYFKILWELF